MLVVAAVAVTVATLAAGCSTNAPGERAMPPLVFVPGLGMSTLQVDVDPQGIAFDFLVPAMNPVDVLPDSAASALDFSIGTGLPADRAGEVASWLALGIGGDGSASNHPGVQVAPVSFGRDFAAECPRYVDMVDALDSRGWELDVNAFCAPYDYRYAPGDNSFAPDLQARVTDVVDASGQKVVLACHSQGCLMSLHALRALDQDWVRENVQLLFGFAGQFSGCSDCLRWSFQPGWSWDPDDATASPVDPTWVGELALDLQPGVYGDTVLYRDGDTAYRAADAVRLLTDVGASAMAQATQRYSLGDQAWFRAGDVDGEPLTIPSRFVYGTDLATVIGYDLTTPEPTAIEADGDGGDSAFMNEAPRRWTANPGCDMRGLPGVTHMDIVTDDDALDLFVRAASSGDSAVPCVTP